MMIRPLTIACMCAASLQIAIWSGLVADWTTLGGRLLGDAAPTLEPATEPRSALTSPSDPLNRDMAAAGEEIRKLKEAWRQTSAAQSARAIADLSAAREETRTLRARHGEAEKKVSDALEKQVQERARAEALDRDLAAARQEIQTLKVRQSDGAQQVSAAGQELAQERARAEALDRDLAAARQDQEGRRRAFLRVPTKPAMHSNLKPAGYSDRKPAGMNRNPQSIKPTRLSPLRKWSALRASAINLRIGP